MFGSVLAALEAGGGLDAFRRLLEDPRAITTYPVLPSWTALVGTLTTGEPPPALPDG